MARFQCRACGFDGHGQWNGKLLCPKCANTTEVRAAISVEEMSDEEVNAIASTRMDERYAHLDAELDE